MMPVRGNRPTKEGLEHIRKNMGWWRREARELSTSSRANEIRVGSLITRLLDAIEKG